METIKNAVGMGSGSQQIESGQEPVSGASGSGGLEPYDKGNLEGDSDLGGKAPQHTDTTSQAAAGAASSVGTTQTQGHAGASQRGMSDFSSSSANANTQANNNGQTTSSSATGGSELAGVRPDVGSSAWFKTAMPGAGRSEQGRQERNETNNVDTAGNTRTDRGTTAASTQPEGKPDVGSSAWFQTAIPHGRPKQHPSENMSQHSSNHMNNVPAAVPSSSNHEAPHSKPLAAAERGTHQVGHDTSQGRMNGLETNSGIHTDDHGPLKPADRGQGTGAREGSIPSAGGIPIGSVATEQRRASADARRASRDAGRVPEPAREPAVGAQSSASQHLEPLQHPGAGAAVGSTAIVEDPSPRTSGEQKLPVDIVEPTEGEDKNVTRSGAAHPPPTTTGASTAPDASKTAAPVGSAAVATEESSPPVPSGSDDTAKDGKEGRRSSLFSKIKEKIKH